MTTLAHTGKRSVVVAAVMLTIGLASGFVYFAPSIAKELTQVSAPDSATSGGIGGVAASRKVQCIMPPAWRRACEQ